MCMLVNRALNIISLSPGFSGLTRFFFLKEGCLRRRRRRVRLLRDDGWCRSLLFSSSMQHVRLFSGCFLWSTLAVMCCAVSSAITDGCTYGKTRKAKGVFRAASARQAQTRNSYPVTLPQLRNRPKTPRETKNSPHSQRAYRIVHPRSFPTHHVFVKRRSSQRIPADTYSFDRCP